MDFLEKRRKLGYTCLGVLYMVDYKQLNRLQSEQYVGYQHISVRKHEVTECVQHWHNFFELELILSGSATHIYNGTAYPIERGSAYLLTPVDFHGLEIQEPLELINISFDDVSMPVEMYACLSNPEARMFCRLSENELDRLCMAAKLLQEECKSDGPCKRQLLEYLLKHFYKERLTENTPEIKHLQGIQKAIDYIELHFREPITLYQIAELSGYNESYFSKLFWKVTGQTYKQRVRDLRIGYAKMLLANGFSVTETCFASGFGSLSNFQETFRKECGVSPGMYPQRYKANSTADKIIK